MAIRLPTRRLNRPQNTQAQLNSHSDLARGLKFVAGFGERDLINGVVGALSVDVSTAREGYHFGTRNEFSDPGVIFGDICDFPASGMTVTVIAKSDDWTSYDTNNLYGLVSKSEASSASGRWGVYAYAGSVAGLCSNSGVNRESTFAISGNLVNGRTHIISWVSAGDNAIADNIYLDGDLKGSSATSSIFPLPATSLPLCLGAYDGSSASYYGRFLGDIGLVLIHERALSAAEIRELATNPWQIFMPDRRTIYYDVTGGSNVSPTDGNETHTLTKDSGSYTATGNALTNATDPDMGDTLSISVGAGTTVGTYGTLVLNGTTGAYTYTLDNAGAAVQSLYSGDTGTDTFNYTVSDGNGGTDTSTITITVNGAGELIVFEDWLTDTTALRSILVEVDASISGVETTHYLSTRGYTTGGADTPANTNYLPVVAGGVQLTEELSLDGAGGLSYGDIEIYNLSGERDGWLESTYVWVNRPVRVYLGDLRWSRADYVLIFDGIVDNLDSKSRDRLNIKIRDKLQRLNSPVSDTKLGGSTSNADMLIPLCFGEVSNITPLLTDPATHEYQVHNGAIESIIEVRDNGVPVTVTPSLSTGKFTLSASPAGTITASVQGDKPSAYSNTIADLVERIATGYGKSTTRFTSGDLDAANLAAFESTHTQAVGVYLSSRENCINVIQQLAASVGAQAVISRAGKLQLLQIALPPSGTPTEITAADMVEASLHIVQRVPVKSSVKLGYNKNWTIQNDLQTGIPEAHKDLFTEEYLTVTASDSTVAASYKLDAEPVQRDTLLQVTSEASAEATRELDLYKTPRTVFGFEGFSQLLALELGDSVTITHSRFGLSSGETGVVTKLQPDWINMRVQVEVLI